MPSDEAQSLLWIQRAAHLGDPGAQYSLGITRHRTRLNRLLKPENASESRIEAYKWLQLVATQGYKDSDTVWRQMTAQMTREDVADGNRRVAAFVATRPNVTQGA